MYGIFIMEHNLLFFLHIYNEVIILYIIIIICIDYIMQYYNKLLF